MNNMNPPAFGKKPDVLVSHPRESDDALPWACMYTDVSTCIIGECGKDLPSFVLPTLPEEQEKAFRTGSISDWSARKAMWQPRLQTMFHKRPYGLITTLPPFLSPADAQGMIDALFECGPSAVFVTTPWMASLMMAANDSLNGVVVHFDDRCCTVAMIRNVSTSQQSVFRLPFSASELSNPDNFEALVEEIAQALLLCEPAVRKALAPCILLSGMVDPSMIDNFRTAIVRLCHQLIPDAQDLKFRVSATVPNTFEQANVWTGLSVIGCLSPVLLRNPKIGDGYIGFFMTKETHKCEGAKLAFSADNAPTLLPFELPLANKRQRSVVPSIWDSEEQWAAVHIEGSAINVGVCGALLPRARYTSKEAILKAGRVTSWDEFDALLSGALSSFGIDAAAGLLDGEYTSHGLIICLPDLSDIGDIIHFAHQAFQEHGLPRVMFINPQVAVLRSLGKKSGLVFHAAADAVSIVPIFNGRIIHAGVDAMNMRTASLSNASIATAVAKSLFMSIIKCPQMRWKHLLANIVVCGEGQELAQFASDLPGLLRAEIRTDPDIAPTMDSDTVDISAERAVSEQNMWKCISQACAELTPSGDSKGHPIGGFTTRAEFLANGFGFIDASFQDAVVVDGKIETYTRKPSQDSLLGANLERRKSVVSTDSGHSGQVGLTDEVRLPSGSTEGLVTLEGWLTKQGGGTKTMLSRRNWKKRWFVLQGHQLTYHKTNQVRMVDNARQVRASSLGCINLLDALGILPHSKQHGFSVNMPDRIFIFVASSDHERDHWIETLNQAWAEASGCMGSPSPMARSRPTSVKSVKLRQPGGWELPTIPSSNDLFADKEDKGGERRVSSISQVVSRQSRPTSGEDRRHSNLSMISTV